MSDMLHTDDLLSSFPNAPGYRIDLLPGWVKGLAAIIFLLSLFFCYAIFEFVTQPQSFGQEDLVQLLFTFAGIASGVAAAGLLMEYRWAVTLSLIASAGVLVAFICLLGYDLFLFRRKLWPLMLMETFTISVTLLYIRALWKVRTTWRDALPSEPSRGKARRK